MMLSSVGHDFVEAVSRYRETAFFGFMIRDDSRGRVRGNVRGTPLVSYRMNRPDFARFRHGIDTLARLYLAAGAREVMIPGSRRLPLIRCEADLDRLWQSRPAPRDFLMTAYHPLGTARIARSPKQGVCDPDHRVFGLDGLFVMDGAAVPSALGANPQVTIMTLALRAARRLAGQLTGSPD
jgi:choline dehydrogenase-like flavoprotein